MTKGLVLSLFPGADLLGLAFEQEGFTVVRGPDVFFGTDIRAFKGMPGKFDGVIGGPPCQMFSTLARINRARGIRPKHGNLIPEFERVVEESGPAWFVMENVPAAPVPKVPGYIVTEELVLDYQVGGLTTRNRRFSFGSRGGAPFQIRRVAVPADFEPYPAITGDPCVVSVGERIRNKDRRGNASGGVLPGNGRRMPFKEACRRQGLSDKYLDGAAFTDAARRQMVGNGVPIAMGKAVARAVIEAMSL